MSWVTGYNTKWWWRRKSKATNRMVSLVKEQRKSRAVQWRWVVGQEVGHRCLTNSKFLFGVIGDLRGSIGIKQGTNRP